MGILKYKLFKDSEEFEEFQKNNDMKICNLSPMLNSMSVETPSANSEQNLETSIGLFVVYSLD